MLLDLIIMAGGLGSRFGGAKQFTPVSNSGAGIMDYSIHDALKYGFRKIFIIVSPSAEDLVRAKYATLINKGQLDVIIQSSQDIPEQYSELAAKRTKPWGTGHIIYLLRQAKLAEYFALINADDFYGADAFNTAVNYLGQAKSIGGGAMLGYKLGSVLSENGTVNRGICVTQHTDRDKEAELYLSNIIEKTGLAKEEGRIIDSLNASYSMDTLTSMNFWIFNSKWLTLVEKPFISFLAGLTDDETIKKEFLIMDYVNELISSDHRIDVLPFDGQCIGVTYKEDLQIIKARLQQLEDAGFYPGLSNLFSCN